MKRSVPIFIIIMLVMIFLPSCTSKKAKPVNENVERGKEVNHDFFTSEEKKKMGITDRTSVEIHSTPQLKNQYFVKVVDNVDWFESLYRVKVNGYKKMIERVPEVDAMIVDDVTFYTEADHFTLPDKYIPILLAVTISTHMGNGNTIFFAFTKDGTMRTVLETGHTVDRNYDTTNGEVFENGSLDFYFQGNKKNKEYSDIVFYGRVYQYGVKNNDTTKDVLYQITDVEYVYSYNQKSSRYEETSRKEDVMQKVPGISSYGDHWDKEAKSHPHIIAVFKSFLNFVVGTISYICFYFLQ